MKKLTQLFLMVSLCILSAGMITLSADAKASKIKKSGDYKYEVTSGRVTVVKYIGNAKKVKIPAKIAGRNVTAIADNAFSGNAKIKEITIPAKASSLGAACFQNCTNLTSVNLPDSVDSIPASCFSGCTKLNSVELGNIEDFGKKAFSHCSGLSGELNLNSVSNIDSAAFEYCTGITKANLSDNLQLLGNAFGYSSPESYYPKDVNTQYAGRSNPFAHCTSLMEFSLPSTNANYQCTDGIMYSRTDNWLVAYPAGKSGSLVINNTVKGIAEYAFSGAKINNVQFNESIEYYQKGAFEGSDITNLNILKFRDTFYSDDLFTNCKNLTTVTFSDKPYEKCGIAFKDCTALKTITMPEGTEALPRDFCNGCTALETVTPLNQVDFVFDRCFKNCKALRNIDLSKIQYIGEEAFDGCSSFTGKLEMNNITTICKRAFASCTAVTEVVIAQPASNMALGVSGDYASSFSRPGSINFIDYGLKANPFAGCTSLNSITVPEGSNYKTVSGVLYTGSMTELVCYPAGRTGKCNLVYGVTTIDESAIEGSKVTEINLPDSLELIYSSAFKGTGITSITIPKNVKCISLLNNESAFKDCTNLESIKVKKDNNNFKAVDGVLYTKMGKTYRLAVYPQAKNDKTFKLPKTINGKKVRLYSSPMFPYTLFDNCKNLKKVVIPEGIKEMFTLFGNSSQVKLYLPKSINKFTENKYQHGSSDKTSFFDETCRNCTVYVYKNSKIHKYAVRNGIKFKLIKK